MVIFHSPSHSFSTISAPPQSFDFDLSSVFHIMSPLGVLWHPIEKKGHDFASTVKYLGFLWDLDLRIVSLLDKKQLKLLIKVNSFLSLSSSTVSWQDCLSFHGSFQHVTFIYKEGHSTIPPLSTFTAKFPNNFSWRHVPASIVDSVCWWKWVLSAPCGSCSLTSQLKIDPDIWVDA